MKNESARPKGPWDYQSPWEVPAAAPKPFKISDHIGKITFKRMVCSSLYGLLSLQILGQLIVPKLSSFGAALDNVSNGILEPIGPAAAIIGASVAVLSAYKSSYFSNIILILAGGYIVGMYADFCDLGDLSLFQNLLILYLLVLPALLLRIMFKYRILKD